MNANIIMLFREACFDVFSLTRYFSRAQTESSAMFFKKKAVDNSADREKLVKEFQKNTTEYFFA